MVRTDVAPSLEGLATRIRKEQRAIKATFMSTVAHAMAAGDLLIEAKAQLKHGEWLPWLTVHCEIEERVAQNYMLLARNRPEIEAKYESDSDLTIRKALRLVAPTPGSRTVVEFIAPPSPPPSGGRPSDAFSLGALPVERQNLIEHGQSVLAEEAAKPGAIAWLRDHLAAAVDAVPILRRPPPSLEGLSDEELEKLKDDAMDTLATLIIESATDNGESPEGVRMFLNDIADLFQRCHPQKLPDYLRRRGNEVVAEAAAESQTMKLSGGSS